MAAYTIETLQILLENKTEFLVDRMKQKIPFNRTVPRTNIAYEWFEVYPDNMDISLGGVDYSNGSWGSDFLKGSEIFGEEADIFLDTSCTELFFNWFAKGFIEAGGDQILDTYLISYHDSSRYYALQHPHWITREEYANIRCKNKTTQLKHITGLVFNFPCFYTDKEEQYEDEEYGEHDIHFFYNNAYFTLKIYNEYDKIDPIFDQDIPTYIQNACKKYLDSAMYIRSTIQHGMEHIELTGLDEDTTQYPLPTASFLIRDKISGTCFKYVQMYWANEDEEQLFSICFECEAYIKEIHQPVYDALVTLPV
jgi:hypothetical protein